MKRFAIIFFVLVFLGGGVFSNVQADDKQKAIDDLTKFFRDTGLAIQGYDLICVHAIEEMEKEGKLSHGQAQYLINRECKKPDVQQQPVPLLEPFHFPSPQPSPSFTCPICGQTGTSRVGLNGIYYVCPRGHAWR